MEPKNVKTPLNYNYKNNNYFKTTLPSCTVPDQTMSLKTLLERNSRGLPITGQEKEPQYYGDENPPINPKTLDLTEINQLASENASLIKQLQDELRESTSKKEKEKLKKLLLKEIEEQNQTP